MEAKYQAKFFHKRSSSAFSQVILVSLICFCCPGLFNALTSFASGVKNPSTAFIGNAIIYGFFAFFSLIAAAFINWMGTRKTLFIGTLGYSIYVASLLNMKVQFLGQTQEDTELYFYLACILLGISAGFLWTAQGQLCMSYATSDTKGYYLSVFWIIFNLGGTSGGLISFVLNFSPHNTTNAETSSETYVAFIILMVSGSCIALFLTDTKYVQREDGSLITIKNPESWLEELTGVFKSVTDVKMLLLIPLFVYSNWFYTYHSFYNAYIFNTRTSGLASAMYWSAQMLGAHCMGKYLDRYPESHLTRKNSLVFFGFLVNGMWIFGWIMQRYLDLSYDRRLLIDFLDIKRVVGPLALYIYYGWNDAICQVWIYWFMGTLSLDTHVLGHYAGFYQCLQSAGATIAWSLGGIQVDPMIQLKTNWILCNVGLTCGFQCIRLASRSGSNEEKKLLLKK